MDAEVFNMERILSAWVEKNLHGEQQPMSSVLSQSTFVAVWEAFMKWSLGQLDLGRAVNCHPFAVLGYNSEFEDPKAIFMQLSDTFILQYALTFRYDEKLSVQSFIPGPSIKINYVAIAKTGGLEKAMVTSCLSSIFTLIGEILADIPESEVDLGVLGKLSSEDRFVTFAPHAKNRPGYLLGKSTVKNLISLQSARDKPLIEPTPPSQDASFRREKRSERRIKETGRINASFTSSTIQNTSLSAEMLGAGTNPRARVQQYSQMLNDPSQLLKTNFKKPPIVLTRFPPVLDVFSRTIAAPISSLKTYVPLTAKIASYYTPSAKTLIIDTESRTIKFLPDETQPMLKANTDPKIDQLPTSNIYDQQAIKIKGETEDKRRKEYINTRYQHYIENEISTDVIAPIRQYWITNILGFIPADMDLISKEKIELIIDQMLNEINKEYYIAGRKSILDYVLKDENERSRLGIEYNPHPPVDYGSQPYDGIEPDEAWQNNVLIARMLISDNLCICSMATLGLKLLWHEYEDLRLVDLPDTFETVTLSTFIERQEAQIGHVRNLLMTDWCARCVEIIKEELENTEMDRNQAETFFEAMSSLMSNQIRSLISESINDYVNFFRRFKRDRYLTPTEVIESNFTQWFPVFLELKLTVENAQVQFTDDMTQICGKFLKVIEEIVQQSHNLPRPENSITKSDKQYLWNVLLEDEIVRDAILEVEQIINGNLEVILMSTDIYSKYFYLLTEIKNTEKFIADNESREKFKAEVDRFLECSDEMSRLCPVRIRMNMSLVQCGELNATMQKHIDEIVRMLTKAVSNKNIDRESVVAREFDTMHGKLGQQANNEDKLVELEEYIDKCQEVEIPNLIAEYEDIKEWLKVLYDTPYNVDEQDLHPLHQCHTLIAKIYGCITENFDRIRDERDKLQKMLRERKNSFVDELESIEDKINTLKSVSERAMADKANEDICRIKKRLEEAQDEMNQINEREELIGWTMTEFPKLEESLRNIKPFDELFSLATKLKESEVNLEKSYVSNIVPDTVEKENKQMISLANKLQGYFGSKEGMHFPTTIAEQMVEKLTGFRKEIPVIKVICTQGMQDRHWTAIGEEIGDPSFRIDPDTSYKRAKQFELENHIRKLEDIAESAAKEFGNKRLLDRMEGEWDGIMFEAKEWGESGTYILGGQAIEDIQTILDDHILKTQTMKGSPYAQVYIERIKAWEAWLLLSFKIIEIWLKVQQHWLYLEPVFASADIKKQLANEATIFEEVDDDWRRIMAELKRDETATVATKAPNLYECLCQSFDRLEIVAKELENYLGTKRLFFPRFFFLSNEDLLSILKETRDPKKVQPHLKKCFEGIKSLQFDEDNKISAMFSVENEKVDFVKIIDPALAEGAVEKWLVEVEDDMLKSVREMIYLAWQDYPKKDRHEWVLEHKGQAVLCISMTYWTKDAEEAMEIRGRAGLIDFLGKCNKLLEAIIGLVRGDLSFLSRCTMKALIVLDVHARDVIGLLVDEGIEDSNDFSWQSQMRYYWENDDMLVRIINAELGYNYEYLGNSERLVITALTDRCYRTLCSAIQLEYGGAPEGPAGTGKTETVKDLAKALARQCVVFNCSDGLDYLAMGKFFKGLASSGAWSCFDEFNRIDPEVLSVIAQQLLTIQIAIKQGLTEFTFEGTDIGLKKTCNCFITMNPGYAGRSELPDNLKALFRTVAMMVPDYAIIAENVLYSYGFTDARNLARKIVTTYKLCSEQLSSQSHYDYGMRAVKSVLVAAGNLKRRYVEEDESILMLRAINDVNLAKFLAFDLPLFAGITSDLFPGVVLPEPDYADLLVAMNEEIEVLELQPHPYFIMKIIQLYEMILVRHGLMIVGLPFSGKTSALNVLKGALSRLDDKGLMEEHKVLTFVLNPKSITMNQLYGQFDEISKDWKDGILANGYKDFARNESDDRKWLIFDGPVDALWIESMNTVLDDNKKLCLTNGEIVAMSTNMNLIFEPMDLAVASPATVSRCGMIYVEPEEIGWQHLFDSWKINNLPSTFGEQEDMELVMLTEWLVQPLLDEVSQKMRMISPTQIQCLVQSMLRLLKIQLAVFNEQSFFDEMEEKERIKLIDTFYVFSCIWGLGSCVVSEHRRNFDIFIKRLLQGDTGVKQPKKIQPGLPEGLSCFDCIILHSEGSIEWKRWADAGIEDLNKAIPTKMQPSEIIVPTIDTVRYTYLLKMFVENNIPVLFVGNTGTGKTVYVKDVMYNKLSREAWVQAEIGFSAQTHCNQVQDIIDDKASIRRKRGIFGPPLEKRLFVFVDDLNMPEAEFYGAQPPIEILRAFLDQGGWYDRKEATFKKILDTVVVAAMGPPGGGRSFITQRCSRHFSLISLADFDSETLLAIFSTITGWFFNKGKFPEEVIKIEKKIVSATMEVYNLAVANLLPTPLKSHYTFNLRDFAKVIFGICLSDAQTSETPEKVIRLWAHEIFRVFGDRLTDDDDRMWLLSNVRDLVKKIYGYNFDNIFGYLDSDKDGKVETLDEIRRLLFGYLLSGLGQAQHYAEMMDFEHLTKNCEQALVNYNDVSDAPMDLVLFGFALEHLCRISRILNQPGGHALLVGVGGSGRQSLTRLAAYMAEYDVVTIEITRTYGKVEWREDLKRFLIKAGGKNEPSVFLFTDSHIKDSSFVEDINTLLNTGEVPNLFPPDEKAELLEMVRSGAKQEGKPCDTLEQLFTFFVERNKRNLHVVLAFSPIGDAFRKRLNMFPSLVNCTTIDWFSQWPQDALVSVAKNFLSNIEMDPTVLAQCQEMCQFFHVSTSQWSEKFLKNLKRNYYVTPTSYLELITTFRNLLQENRESIVAGQKRYQIGLEKLITTENSVEGMKVELIELQPKLVIAGQETEAKMERVEVETVEAEKVAKEVGAEEAIAQAAADEAKGIKDECEEKLSEAMPILNKALQALQTLEKSDIDMLKKMASPPQGVKLVMEAVCILKSVDPKKEPDPSTGQMVNNYWPSALKILSDTGFLQSLKDFKKESISDKTIRGLQKYLKEPTFNPEAMESISRAAAGICSWVCAIEKFHHVNKVVAPMQKSLAEAEKKHAKVMAGLQVKQAELKVVQDKLDALNKDLKETKDNKERLENEVEDCKRRLIRAEQLIESLGGEKTTWTQREKQLGEDYITITGDVLISSGIVAYLGPFTALYRNQIVEEWVHDCKQRAIPSAEKFTLADTLGDPVKIRQWNIDGLPRDAFSVENGIIISKARRWPLMIDPQGQANKWIKNMENKENTLYIFKPSDSNYLKILGTKVTFGHPVLMENVGEELDPALEPLLLKQIVKNELKMADGAVEYNHEFKFYMTTKLRNPHYLPEISTKVTLLNFMITPEGLADQLLATVVTEEQPDLARRKEELIVQGARNKEQLKEIEDKILHILSSSEGNILDDDLAISTLSQSKVISNQIEEEQKIAEETEVQIDDARSQYKPNSERTSLLFFCIADLANIDPMYQYSLEFFNNLYKHAIFNSEPSEDIPTRLTNLDNFFTYVLYCSICRSLFEKDKLLFAFMLCLKIHEYKQELNTEQLRFLMTGGVGLDEKIPDKPDQPWVLDKCWAELFRLSKINAFIGFQDSFEQDLEDWKTIYDSNAPHEEPFPGKWQASLNSFERLLVVRCIRPDMVVPAASNYVTEQMGSRFVEPPPFDLKAIFKDSTPFTPLIFILSPGSAPFAAINAFAQTKMKQLYNKSLGQGQGDAAEELINKCVKSGDWVILQNCHLAVSWMPSLERIVNNLNPEPKATHRDFRLWLTSYPASTFPVSILQNGIKMTNEPPKGLKANLKGSFSSDPINTQSFFEGCTKELEWKKLLFGLCFFNAVLQERRNFGPLGWNIPYEFTESDLRISVQQLQMFLNGYEIVPFKAIHYLAGECNFGGRVTEKQDRKLILTLLSVYYTEEIFQEYYRFSESGTFFAPPTGDHDSYITYIESLPARPDPEVYGFHSNADITKNQGETLLLFDSLLLTQAEAGGGDSGGASMEETVVMIASNITNDLPPLFDMNIASKKYPTEYTDSMNTVLTQELQRFNKLNDTIRKSLKDIQGAVKGQISMSTVIEASLLSLFDGKVPNAWKKNSYPSLKPLGSYIVDLKQRLDFFKDWMQKGHPDRFNISRLFFTQSFLTGALQNYARKYKIPIDEIKFDFEVVEAEKEKPEDGVIVYGLFLEGCRWNDERQILDESNPKVLFTEAPYVLLLPTNERKKYRKYKCPIYKTSERKGVLSTTGHSTNFVMLLHLPTEKEPEHWTKRGVAMLTQLDD